MAPVPHNVSDAEPRERPGQPATGQTPMQLVLVNQRRYQSRRTGRVERGSRLVMEKVKKNTRLPAVRRGYGASAGETVTLA